MKFPLLQIFLNTQFCIDNLQTVILSQTVDKRVNNPSRMIILSGFMRKIHFFSLNFLCSLKTLLSSINKLQKKNQSVHEIQY